jgi:pyrroline-5-carboxylate reductase
MKDRALGFIGGGRVARIIPGGFKKAKKMPAKIVAGDTNPDVPKKLLSGFPDVQASLNNNRDAASQDLVFIGLHPPAISASLAEIGNCLKSGAVSRIGLPLCRPKCLINLYLTKSEGAAYRHLGIMILSSIRP